MTPDHVENNKPILVPGVIIRVPLSALRVFGIRCIVSAEEGAAVVGDGVAVVGAVRQTVCVAGEIQSN